MRERWVLQNESAGLKEMYQMLVLYNLVIQQERCGALYSESAGAEGSITSDLGGEVWQGLDFLVSYKFVYQWIFFREM